MGRDAGRTGLDAYRCPRHGENTLTMAASACDPYEETICLECGLSVDNPDVLAANRGKEGVDAPSGGA